jgi:serine/threonine protein phosphatase 1
MALQSEEWLLWSRNTADRLAAKNQKTIIYGHSAFKNPQIGPESIGIDTGAVYGGNLTCLLLPDHEFIQVRGVKFWP